MEEYSGKQSEASENTNENSVANNKADESVNDLYVNISFSENDVEAYADFNPPTGKSPPLTPDYVKYVLEKMNIVHGIKNEVIQEAILACNLEKKIQKGVLIAQGTPAVNEVSEYVQFNPALTESRVPVIPNAANSETPPGKNARVDHRTISPFIVIKKGQAIAKKKSRKPGVEGIDVHGAAIPFKIINPKSVEGGENTKWEGQFLVSAISGQMVDEKGVIHVRNSLVIKGPVGYKTGNIVFPGDVLIEGPVSDGFKINSGGSVTIKQTFDVTEAVTKGDLIVVGGIIGRNPSLIKVGGCLQTKFIDNCRVACRKNIMVTKEIISSEIYTLEKLEMTDKGMIIGGEVYAVRGIRAGGIGKKGTKAAKIHCGIDFTAEQEKEKNNSRLRLLAAKLKSTRQLLEDTVNDNAKKIKLEELKTRLEEEQRKAALRISELMDRIVVDENASVVISGEICSDTLIEICQVELIVTEPLRKVKITLDRDAGKLITTPL